MTGAVTYIHKSLNFHEMIAGPNDLAGFIDPPETGLICKAREIYTRKNNSKKRKQNSKQLQTSLRFEPTL